MLNATKSILVLVDAPANGVNRSSIPLTPLHVLSDAAALLAVPIIFTRYPDTTATGLIAAAWPAWKTTNEIRFDPAAPNCATTPLGRAIASTERSQMIVCGLWLEEAITLLALSCLALGIDSYLPIDATPAINPVHAATAQARLTQAGAVPTTSEQVLREWGALNGDGVVQTKLIALLNGNSVGSPLIDIPSDS